MNPLSLLPKLAVFGVAAVVGSLATSLLGAILTDRAPVTAVTEAPSVQLQEDGSGAGEGQGVLAVAFDLEEGASEPQELVELSPEEIAAAAAALIGDAPPAPVVDPTGFPRVPAVTQFDGSPKGNQNCTLASGAMLARLATGIVTTGGILRDLQDVADGGTNLNDLNTALRRGYGVEFERGKLTIASFRQLLAAGAGAVIQGVYGQVPDELRLQPTFIDPHAVYIDGFYPGDEERGLGPAYFVIDPLGRPSAGYRGDWWPARIVEKFATAFGGGRINAMWAFPAGAVDPGLALDVIPLGSGSGGSAATPAPGVTPEPGAVTPEPGATPPADPGAVDPGVPEPPPAVDGTPTVGGLDLLPGIAICTVDPPPPGCPSGIRAVFEGIELPELALPPAPTVTVKFVVSDRPGFVAVGYVIDPAMTSEVRFWKQGAEGTLFRSLVVKDGVPLPVGVVSLAALVVEAATTYHFQVVGYDATTTVTGPVGTFTTGAGLSRFEVAVETVDAPEIGVVDPAEALTPFRRLLAATYAFPVRIADVATGCGAIGTLGSTQLCLDVPLVPVPIVSCPAVRVDYELAGIGGTGVKVRAFPRDRIVDADGTLVLDGGIEAVGPAGAGSVSVGCLTPGIEYVVVIDAIGDTTGILGGKLITVP